MLPLKVLLRKSILDDQGHKYNIWASILHGLGNISKLPNQCENILKFFFCSWKLPNQCKLLAHRVCASILHWLGSFQDLLGSFQYCNLPNQCKMLAYTLWASILHWLGNSQDARMAFFYSVLPDIYPINVKCLCIPYVQAFHIDWAILKMPE